MAALRAGLPVIKSYNTTTGFEHTTYAIKPKHLANWAMAAVGDIGLKVEYKLAHVRYTPCACVDQPITGLPHAHALCTTQHVVRIVYMPPDHNHEMHKIWSVDSQENY